MPKHPVFMRFSAQKAGYIFTHLFFSSTMSNTRLYKAFKKHGIHLEATSYGWNVFKDESSASILLPHQFQLEEKAVQQLLNFASVVPGSCTCATPDFHPGTHAPVGSIVQTPEGYVIPKAIGTDINCGMRTMKTGLNMAHVAPHTKRLQDAMSQFILHGKRNLPLQTQHFKSLYDDQLPDFMELLSGVDAWKAMNVQQRHAEWSRHVGLSNFQSHSRHAPHLHIHSQHEWIRDPQLATPGGGNHFVEIQVVDKVLDKTKAWEQQLREGDVVVTLHSGSRDVGFYIGQQWMDAAKQQWPAGVKHPEHGLYALEGALAHEYLEAMGTAARYAWFNRFCMDEQLRQIWDQQLGCPGWSLLVDVPHNVIMPEANGWVHRKGATPAHAGQLGIIPGSMGDFTYVVEGMGNDQWLQSCSHGAGRSVQRQQMRAKHLNETGHWNCLTLNDTRKIEEHPSAYKPIGPVIEQQEQEGLIQSIVRLAPLWTFKV